MIFLSLGRNPPNPLSLSPQLYKRTLLVGSSLIPLLNLKCYNLNPFALQLCCFIARFHFKVPIVTN